MAWTAVDALGQEDFQRLLAAFNGRRVGGRVGGDVAGIVEVETET
jgi:hypothetical protein